MVRLLEPSCWAVYKLARYLQQDQEDLVAVLLGVHISGLRFDPEPVVGVFLRAAR